MTAKEMFEELSLKEKIKEYEYKIKKTKLLRKQENLQDLKKDLLFLQEKVIEWLNKDCLFFNISTADNLDLAYKIFKKGEQFSFGHERYHWHHIYMNKRGIVKLEKMIIKTDKKLKAINKQVEELGVE